MALVLACGIVVAPLSLSPSIADDPSVRTTSETPPGPHDPAATKADGGGADGAVEFTLDAVPDPSALRGGAIELVPTGPRSVSVRVIAGNPASEEASGSQTCAGSQGVRSPGEAGAVEEETSASAEPAACPLATQVTIRFASPEVAPILSFDDHPAAPVTDDADGGAGDVRTSAGQEARIVAVDGTSSALVDASWTGDLSMEGVVSAVTVEVRPRLAESGARTDRSDQERLGLSDFSLAVESRPVDLSVGVAAPGVVAPGDDVEWTVSVSNTSTEYGSHGLLVGATIPDAVEGAALESGPEGCRVGADEIVCEIAPPGWRIDDAGVQPTLMPDEGLIDPPVVLAPGTSLPPLTLRGTVSQDAHAPVVFDATVGGVDPDADGANDQASATTELGTRTGPEAEAPFVLAAPDASDSSDAVRPTPRAAITKFGSAAFLAVDAADHEIALEGAVIKLYLTREDAVADTNAIALGSVETPILDWTTDADGLTSIVGLRYSNWQNGAAIPDEADWRTYWIAETGAPRGYELLPEPVPFYVTGLGTEPPVILPHVPSNTGFGLPLTGGSGTTPVFLGAVVLLAGAAGIGILRARTSRVARRS